MAIYQSMVVCLIDKARYGIDAYSGLWPHLPSIICVTIMVTRGPAKGPSPANQRPDARTNRRFQLAAGLVSSGTGARHYHVAETRSLATDNCLSLHLPLDIGLRESLGLPMGSQDTTRAVGRSLRIGGPSAFRRTKFLVLSLGKALSQGN